MTDKIRSKHLVSLNTARIKLRKNHPRISDDLKVLFEFLKELFEKEKGALYSEDGYLDIEQ